MPGTKLASTFTSLRLLGERVNMSLGPVFDHFEQPGVLNRRHSTRTRHPNPGTDWAKVLTRRQFTPDVVSHMAQSQVET